MMTLWDALRLSHDWTGTLADLVAHSNSLASVHPASKNHYLRAKTRYTAIDYRSQNIISPPLGKRFAWLHLVQFCAARYLIEKGWSREAVSAWIQRLNVGSILEAVTHTELSSPSSSNSSSNVASGSARKACSTDELLKRASIVIQLLAVGIVEQYIAVQKGKPIVHDNTLNSSLARAMMGLASLYLLEGKVATSGSVHDLLLRCRSYFSDPIWGLDIFLLPDFPYRELRLLDPDARLPTLDCNDLAKLAKNEINLLERLAFDDLLRIVKKSIGRESYAYTAIRQFIVEHPITNAEAIDSFTRKHQLLPARSFLFDCYDNLSAHHLVNGDLYICRQCKSPMKRSHLAHHAGCRLTSCQQYDRPKALKPSKIVHNTTLVAKQHLMLYWVAPGLDEIRIFKRAEELKLNPTLYPSLDSCDVELDNGRIGIDAKSSASPFLLAERLSRNLGGLASYSKRIVAINDRCAARVPDYMRLLRREYRGALHVEFSLVSTLIKRMEEPL